MQMKALILFPLGSMVVVFLSESEAFYWVARGLFILTPSFSTTIWASALRGFQGEKAEVI